MTRPRTNLSPTSASSGPGHCCIVGGGPAGVMLGYLLARAGVRVTVLEKHGDFLRDFRGDTVHPSTLQILKEIGLLEKFAQLPQRKVTHLGVHIGGKLQPLVDFRGLKPFDYISLVPQWDFLNFLTAEAASRYPHFELRMRHEAKGLIEENGRYVGVQVRSPEGEEEIRCDLVVACDGRHSILRRAAGLQPHDFGAPMDVLWLRLGRKSSDSEDTFGIVGDGHLMVMLNRGDYWQIAYLVPKGGDRELRAQPIETLCRAIASLAPFLADRLGELRSWDDLKTLEVRVDRLERWYRPGLLVIGDAAHAMSPIGGVGINLAIQDAVAAANFLAAPLRANSLIDEPVLEQIQHRRLRATRLIQWIQVQAQNRIITSALRRTGRTPQFPAILRWLLRFRVIRNIPARLVGYGLRAEHVHVHKSG